MKSFDTGGAFLYTLAIGIVAGIAAALVFSIGIALPLACIGAALALIVLGVAVKNKYLFLVAILLVAVSLGIVRTGLFHYKESQENISSFTGKATILGTVSNDPAVSGAHLQANILVASVNNTAAKGTVLAFFPPQTNLIYGEEVTVQGTLAAPASFTGDNGNIFDYPTYLRVEGVSMLLNQAQAYSIQPAGVSIYGILFGVKHAFDTSLERLLPEPDASLLEGILLGQRKGLSKDLTDAFVIAGLIHIVILSGYSMSVVSQGILSVLGFLPRRWQMLLAGMFMIAFVLMTGAAATTVRACAMALVALTARYFHRSALALRSLVAVATAMVLYNPPLILGDASFFTSVLATFGLIVFSPRIEQMLWRVPQKYEIRAIITSTVAVQIFALPALLYFTGNISFLSVPANLLVLPLLPFVMIAGLLTGVVGFFGATLAFVPAVVSDLFLKWIQLVAHMVEVIPFASATTASFPLWLALVIYIPLSALAVTSYISATK